MMKHMSQACAVLTLLPDTEVSTTNGFYRQHPLVDCINYLRSCLSETPERSEKKKKKKKKVKEESESD